MRHLIAVFVCLALAGCVPQDIDHDGVIRIACVGDSITAAGWVPPGGESGPNRWCEYAAAQCTTIGSVPTQFYNFGIGGATAGTIYSQTELYGDPGLPGFGAYPNHADAVVELFGINNIGLLGQTPSAVADAVVGVCQDVFFTHHLFCYGISLGPNADPAYNAAMTAKAQAVFGAPATAADSIDGTSCMTVYDGTHLDDASERLLGQRVAQKLGCDS